MSQVQVTPWVLGYGYRYGIAIPMENHTPSCRFMGILSGQVSGHMTLLIQSQILNNRLMTTNTPNCHHEQLLMGWKQSAMMMGMTRQMSRHNNINSHHPLSLSLTRGGGFLFILGNHTCCSYFWPLKAWYCLLLTSWSLVGSARGNPQVYFLISIPIPMNTIPTWVGVQYYCGFLWVTHAYSWVSA